MSILHTGLAEGQEDESAEAIQAKLVKQSELERKVERLAKVAKQVEEDNRRRAMGLGMLHTAAKALDDLEYQLPVRLIMTGAELEELNKFKRMLRTVYDREIK